MTPIAGLVLARMCVGAERPEEGERAIRTTMPLNPHHRVNYLAVLADSLVHQNRNREALDVLADTVKRNPNYISAYLNLVGLHAQARDRENARDAIGHVLRINPAYRLAMARQFYLSSDKELQERFVSALRLAGPPE